jgi:hypothetical protein
VIKVNFRKLTKGMIGGGIAATMLLGASAWSCSGPSGQTSENRQSNANLWNAEHDAPAPVFNQVSTLRWAMIETEAAQVLGLPSTVFVFEQGMTQGPILQCAAIGYPNPGGTELTNPFKMEGNGNGNIAVANIDPNQVYPPSTSEGTFFLCTEPGGQVVPVYGEPNVLAWPGLASWVMNSPGKPYPHINPIGTAAVAHCVVTGAGTKNAKTTCTAPAGVRTRHVDTTGGGIK